MSRMAGAGELTLDLLRRDVPVFQEGRRAGQALAGADAPTDMVGRQRLARLARDGEAAQERLVLAAIPLIKHLAAKEHARRQRWQSQITFEDLFQEGVGGLLRGLAAYNPDGGQKSPTNYLGQWIMIEMRRNVESSDNDFGVAFDAAERMRKIRALRSRLSAELGREPTDEEIIEASGDMAYAGGRKIGRVNKPDAPRKRLTMAQLAEERDLRARVGATGRLVAASGGDEPEVPLVDFARPLTGAWLSDAAEPVVARGAASGLARLIQQTLDVMALPSTQREVVARRYGLPPHEREESGRDISRSMNLHRDKVSKVLEAFTAEMTRPGGAFHRACASLDEDELADLGLSWVVSSLGDLADLPDGAADGAVIPDILTVPMTDRAGSVAPPSAGPPTGRRGVRAQFACPVHQFGFVGVYPDRPSVPKRRSCPACGEPSRLVRLMEV
jgi:RNA polymerase sigma factor (sigma-70 family)